MGDGARIATSIAVSGGYEADDDGALLTLPLTLPLTLTLTLTLILTLTLTRRRGLPERQGGPRSLASEVHVCALPCSSCTPLFYISTSVARTVHRCTSKYASGGVKAALPKVVVNGDSPIELAFPLTKEQEQAIINLSSRSVRGLGWRAPIHPRRDMPPRAQPVGTATEDLGA